MSECGFSKIPTGILEKLYSPGFKLNSEPMRTFLFIARKTYGWNKSEDVVSESQFVEALCIKKQNVHRAIKYLEDRNIINVVRRDRKKGRIFSINENLDSWIEEVISQDDQKSSHRITKPSESKSKKSSHQITEVISQDDQKSSQEMDTIYKRHLTKDISLCLDFQKAKIEDGERFLKESSASIPKKPKRQKPELKVTDLHLSIADHLLESIRANKPDYKPTFSKADRIRWAEDARLMIDKESRVPETIMKVISWCQHDSFWKTNILSVDKLRKKFDELEFKMKNQQSWGKKITQQQEMSGLDYFNRPQKSIEELMK